MGLLVINHGKIYWQSQHVKVAKKQFCLSCKTVGNIAYRIDTSQFWLVKMIHHIHVSMVCDSSNTNKVTLSCEETLACAIKSCLNFGDIQVCRAKHHPILSFSYFFQFGSWSPVSNCTAAIPRSVISFIIFAQSWCCSEWRDDSNRWFSWWTAVCVVREACFYFQK